MKLISHSTKTFRAFACLLAALLWIAEAGRSDEAAGEATAVDGSSSDSRTWIDAGPPFGKLPLVQDIDCAAAPPEDLFREFPKQASHVTNLLGAACRVLPNAGESPRYFAYRIGRGRGLKPGTCYVLSVEYPEDRPRSFHILNWGCEVAMGLATGSTVGDVLKGRYVNHNPESIQYPFSSRYECWRQLFYLHDRFPDIQRPRGLGKRPLTSRDGFWVIIAQPEPKNAPLSAGAAVRRIRLFEVPQPERYNLRLRLPPAELPRRYIFSREEMADGVIALGHAKAQRLPELRGVTERAAWFEYKARVLQFLGFNTFCTDLLEFGHNQGWDSGPGGGNAWYYQSADPSLWEQVLERLGKYPLTVLPYYEYAGSIGHDPNRALGSQRRCRTLQGRRDYTHIEWCHKANADFADPAFVTDAKQLLDLTITRFKDRVRFLGAWFRARPELNPISFNDGDLARFTQARGLKSPVTRRQLQSEAALLKAYYEWWFEQRRRFLTALADHLRAHVQPEALIFYTTETSEPGPNLPARLTGRGHKDWWKWKTVVVTDQPERWEAILATPRYQSDPRFQFLRVIAFDRVVAEDLYTQTLRLPRETWGSWEWQHACPRPDPEHYRDQDRVLLTYPFNRLYTVASEDGLEAFRTRAGLGLVRHFPLNEHELRVGNEDLTGYFVSDVERAGPYCVAAEVRAMAWGDPRFLGYLAGNAYHRGFPEYVRRFHAAFLALPALPSRIWPEAASRPGVVVRRIDTPRHGTYLAVINTTFEAQNGVSLSVPVSGEVIVENAATCERLGLSRGSHRVVLDLPPCSLTALHVRAKQNNRPAD